MDPFSIAINVLYVWCVHLVTKLVFVMSTLLSHRDRCTVFNIYMNRIFFVAFFAYLDRVQIWFTRSDILFSMVKLWVILLCTFDKRFACRDWTVERKVPNNYMRLGGAMHDVAAAAAAARRLTSGAKELISKISRHNLHFSAWRWSSKMNVRAFAVRVIDLMFLRSTAWRSSRCQFYYYCRKAQFTWGSLFLLTYYVIE